MKIMRICMKILCGIGIFVFGMGIVVFTILTYMWAFSPYTLKMFECIAYNFSSLMGLVICSYLFLKQNPND